MPSSSTGAAGAQALAALGPFFAVGVHAPGDVPVLPWRPVSSLTGSPVPGTLASPGTPSPGPPGPLADRVASVRAALAARGGLSPGDIDPKVAASAVHLGIAARLVAPALGASVLGLRLDLRDAWWQDGTGGPVPLSAAAPPGPPVEPGPPGSSAFPGAGGPSRLLREVLVPLTAAVRRVVPVSGRVLKGNVASGINSAAAQIARARPDLAGPAWEAARELAGDPWLACEPCPPGPGFRRASCCLFYRLASAGTPRSAVVCGDCVLA